RFRRLPARAWESAATRRTPLSVDAAAAPVPAVGQGAALGLQESHQPRGPAGHVGLFFEQSGLPLGNVIALGERDHLLHCLRGQGVLLDCLENGFVHEVDGKPEVVGAAASVSAASTKILRNVAGLTAGGFDYE